MMKSLIPLFFLIASSFTSCIAQGNADQGVNIIPEPFSVNEKKGYFYLNKTTAIKSQNQRADGIANLLANQLSVATGYPITVVPDTEGIRDNAIVFKLNRKRDVRIGEAGYTLSSSKNGVLIVANEPKGLFYGMQSLMQLLPPEIGSKTVVKRNGWGIPNVEIVDFPRFGWRGLMLDVSRYFFSKEFIKQYIDEMSKYKLNVFHWHLTDDQGWRIEIKGLPELTDVGAWRVARTGRWGSFKMPQEGEKATYGGYYSQDDIREIVKYANKRFVTILPEIDVPAHSLALIAAYPHLSSTKAHYPITPQHVPAEVDNVLDISSDSTWQVLDIIFSQVAKLFPGPYIHVGGDEAKREFWLKNPNIMALMNKGHIKSPEELQSYFEKRLEKLIVSKGKKMIGWDEILEGGLAPEATVMSWRGEQGGIEAAKMGHHVIMTPVEYCYLDHFQGDPMIEPPAGGGLLRLSKCYAYEPLPEGIDPEYVLGGQGDLWCEGVPNGRHVEYMTWPRGMALSEVFWSAKNKRNWSDFFSRVEHRFKYLDIAQVNYSRSVYDPIIEGIKDTGDVLKVKLGSEVAGVDIYYRFDMTNPDNFSPKYKGEPLNIPLGATEIKVITYRDNKPIGKQINIMISEIAKRANK